MRIFVIAALSILFTAPAYGGDACMKSVGAAHGANLFNTYTTIGAIADGYNQGMYSKTEVRDLMATQIAFTKTLRDGLAVLAETKLSKEDKATVQRFQNTYVYLEAEARALFNYTKSGKKSDLALYDEARTKAWTEIEQILGLTND